MTSCSHNTARRVAARAVPAFLVAGLGLSLQAVPALASVEVGTLSQAVETQTNASDTVSAYLDGNVVTFDTLEEALTKKYDRIVLNCDITETIHIKDDSSQFTENIILDGHTWKAATSQSAFTNYARVAVRSGEEGQSSTGKKGALVSMNGTENGVVFLNVDGGVLDIYDTDVTGYILTGGSLNFHGDCKVTGQILNSKNSGNGSAYVTFDGGDYTEAEIYSPENEWGIIANAGTFRDDPLTWMRQNSAARRNDDGTWTVFNLDREKLDEGTYYVNPYQEYAAHVTENNLQPGCRYFRVSRDQYRVTRTEAPYTVTDAQGAETPYNDFEQAVQNAGDGDTVKLYSDVTLDHGITIPADVHINGGGHTITLANAIPDEAFITVQGSHQGFEKVTYLTNLNIVAGDKADVAIALNGIGESSSIAVTDCNIDGGAVFGVSADGSFASLDDCVINPARGCTAAIRYLKNALSWGQVAIYGCQCPDIPMLYVEAAEFDLIKAYLSNQAGKVLSDSEALEMFNGMGVFYSQMYLWPDGHLEDRKPAGYDPDQDTEPEPTPTPDPDPTPTPDPVEDVEIPETEGGKVEVEPVEAGETATVVAEPDAGQEVRDVIVTDPEGNEIDVTVDKDGNYTFEMPEGGATVEVVFGCDGGDLCASHSFGDVTHDDWFHDTVDWAVDEGIFHGYDDGTFGPNDTLTREQAATVMYNYFGGTTGSGSAGMSDVGNDWYTDAVNWAVENGIMTGYSGTDKFGIGDALSREQFCSVIAKAMGADLEDVDLSVLDRFTDAGSVSDWAKPAVAWAVENGLMNGVENADGTRSLQGVRDMTRAEMAAMMKNAVDAGVLTK